MNSCGSAAVERDDVPASEAETVITPVFRTRTIAEVFEIRSAVVGQQVVVSNRRSCPRLETAPGGGVAVVKLSSRSGRVCMVAEGKDRAVDGFEETRRG